VRAGVTFVTPVTDLARRALAVAALGVVLLPPCVSGTRVSVQRDDPRAVQRELTRSALTGSQPSAPTRELLTRLGLRERFERDPDAALAELREGLAPEGDADRLFALAALLATLSVRIGLPCSTRRGSRLAA
jgi:hypothetical protein